jgi:hypothetical protein
MKKQNTEQVNILQKISIFIYFFFFSILDRRFTHKLIPFIHKYSTPVKMEIQVLFFFMLYIALTTFFF